MRMMTVLLAGLAVLASCNTNYETTKSGLQYKLYKGKANGPKLKAGQFAKLNMEYRMKINGKDSVLNTTYGKMPGFVPVDTSIRSQYSLMEVLPLMAAGDSAEFVMSVDTLRKRAMIPAFDSTFKAGGLITGRIKVIETYADEATVQKAFQAEQEKLKLGEIATVEAYLAKKGIKAIKTPGGVFIKLDNPGDVNNKAVAGKQAMVRYKGYLMNKESVVFDQNIEGEKNSPAGYPVVVGTRSVIPGWEEALPYFGKGGKGTIYVPSQMAYGPQAMGPDLPANSNLVFNIEVVDVTAPAPRPAMPGGHTPGDGHNH